MTEYVYLNPPATERLEVEVIGDGVLDLSTVTAVNFSVIKPGGSELTWTASITAQSANLLQCEHVYAGGDVTQVGSYRVMINMTVPAGLERAGPVYFEGVL